MKPLSGRHIVITRPLAQAQTLRAALQAQGALPTLFPLFEIIPLPLPPLRLSEYQLAIFISANATLSFANASWPPSLPVWAVGPATAQALKNMGAKKIEVADGEGSEALLAHPTLTTGKINKANILLVRGDHGRTLLQDTLRARGAQVTELVSYRRICPARNLAPLIALWESASLDALVLTSREALDHLDRLAAGDVKILAQLKQTFLFVTHARIAKAALARGFKHVMESANGEAGLMHSLIAHFHSPIR